MNYELCIELIDYICDVGIKKEEKSINQLSKNWEYYMVYESWNNFIVSWEDFVSVCMK